MASPGFRRRVQTKRRSNRNSVGLGCVRMRPYFSPRYSSGTSSSGTSWVLTSPSSASPASSTPLTSSASNAFPSSSNSSTLSEPAPAIPDNPCKSPDCPPDRAPRPLGSNTTLPIFSLFPRTFFVLRAAFFRKGFLFGATFFAGFFLGAAFLPAAFLFAFFLFLFLVAIRGVYHFPYRPVTHRPRDPRIPDSRVFARDSAAPRLSAIEICVARHFPG